MNETVPTALQTAEALWQHYAGPVPEVTLEALAERFIELRRRLGDRYESNAYRLRSFLKYMKGRGVRRPGDLTLEAMLEWGRSREHASPEAYDHDVGNVSVFFDHLLTLDKIPTNFCRVLRRRYRRTFRPYIFNLEELGRIFDLARRPGPAGTRGLVYITLYAGALRSSEALYLPIKNFDARESTLFIQKTKFQKERLVPIHPAVSERLRQYRDLCRPGTRPDDPLLVNSRGKPWTPVFLSQLFREDLRHLGIFRPTRREGGILYGSPRVHALRHSAAVHRLLKWYRDGADVQEKLPLLSTYLGHSEVEHTQVYLTITGLILREAHARFAGRAEKELAIKP